MLTVETQALDLSAHNFYYFTMQSLTGFMQFLTGFATTNRPVSKPYSRIWGAAVLCHFRHLTQLWTCWPIFNAHTPSPVVHNA